MVKLKKILAKEIEQGWMIPIPISYAKINQIAPIGITQQWQVNHDGSRSEKLRLCHDQSFKAKGDSVNK